METFLLKILRIKVAVIAGEKLDVLSKIVNYIRQRPRQMNADVTLSLTIVEGKDLKSTSLTSTETLNKMRPLFFRTANAIAIFLHENARHLVDKHRNILLTILRLCDSTRRDLLDKVIPENEDVQLVHESINYPILWLKEISWRHGALEKGKTNFKLNYRDIRELIMQGPPKEEESDRCLAEIVRNKLNSSDRIPDLCAEILANRESSRGYPLTHRLLIVQIAKILKCDRGLPSSELILSYCSAILEDLIDIETAGFPYQTPDLTMEQVVLCGMEGFLEFTGKHYERLVLRWSRPSGCFSSFGYKFANNEIRVSRRTSKQTDFGCDSHATGLAAATLSLFIRENLENARW
ncbi:uncharacterized protein LOC100652041 isoform X2 [Bombus terrestris]|uniref:Uncharacterized protein LOC100652041 isoform X2 n=1 Tax=Bombus terrestris TaxID=30195 RepID=A0A9C6SM05_BOMTE|nr:uncharacterized protein LOC100652041 isoform X2 [Bombus terrestris]